MGDKKEKKEEKEPKKEEIKKNPSSSDSVSGEKEPKKKEKSADKESKKEKPTKEDSKSKKEDKKEKKNESEFKTIPQVFNEAKEKFGDKIALKQPKAGTISDWIEYSWNDYHDNVMKVAKSLIKLGLKPKQATSVIGFNSPEWFFASLGTVFAAGVPTGVYTTNSPEQCQYISEHNESFVVFVQNDLHLQKYLKVWENLPLVKAIVVMNDPDFKKHDNVYTWKSFLKLGEEVDESKITKRIDQVKPEDLAELIYTSGTTGPPKGVMLSHKNVTWTVQVLGRELGLGPDDRIVSYLPLSHIAEQVISLHGPTAFGFCVHFATPEALQGALKETLHAVRPTVFLGVPRVWEKFEAIMKDKGAETKGAKKKIATWAKKKGLSGAQKEEAGKKKPKLYGVANKIVFSKIKDALGLDQTRVCSSAAAPISKSTLQYFSSLGIMIHEVYGMSECTGPQTANRPEPGQHKLGTVGKAIPGSEMKIAEDGEICYKGPHIFMGYYKNEEETKIALDDEGWLHSGDIGEVDTDDFLRITDRKKELIITAGGENVAPAIIEGHFRQIQVVSQAVVYGDRQKFLIILFTLDLLALKNRGFDSIAAAKEDKEFIKDLEKQIEEINENKIDSRAQQPKKYAILDEDFSDSAEVPELTPTQKLKRKIIYQKRMDVIKETYGDDFNDDSFEKNNTAEPKKSTKEESKKSKKAEKEEKEEKKEKKDKKVKA